MTTSYHSDEGNGKRESSRAGRASRRTAETRRSCWSSTDSPLSSSARGKSHSSGKTRSLPYSTRRATRRSAETTAASCSCHTRVRFSLKWLPGGSALTVRRRDCYQRSSASFDRIARPRTRCLWCAGCRKLGGRQECLSSSAS